SPDGRRMATAGEDGMLRIWDCSRRRDFKRIDLDVRSQVVLHAAISSDGRRLAVGSSSREGVSTKYGDTVIWDISTPVPERLLTVDPPDGNRDVFALAFSSDDRNLAIASPLKRGGACIRIIEVATGKDVQRLDNCGAQPQWLAFAPHAPLLLVEQG